MKRILSTAVAAVLAAGLGLVPPVAAASAVPSDVVTSSEFFRVTQGNSIDYVRKTFGTDGKVVVRHERPGTLDDAVTIEFPTYYEGGYVSVGFERRSSGRWYLATKHAYWANRAVRTADKATESEFYRVKQGNTIAYVRGTFGTNGTITEYSDSPGYVDDRVVVNWPTASVDGRVSIRFVRSSAGVWKVLGREAYWNVMPARVDDKATDSELQQVRAGNTLDFARRTLGSAGTVQAYVDLSGTASDSLYVRWPTDSEYGFVTLGFVRSGTGPWKVRSRSASWAAEADPSSDPATKEEISSIDQRLDRGDQVTLADVRTVFGSAGTVVAMGDLPGTEDDSLSMVWYVGTGADVSVGFSRTVSGSWVVDDLTPPRGMVL